MTSRLPLLLVVLPIILQPKDSQPSKKLVVQVTKSAIYEEPDSISEVVAIVVEGNLLEPTGPETKGWIRVKFGDKVGYVNKSVVIPPEKWIPSSGDKVSKDVGKINDNSGAKWFSPEVEKKYKEKNKMDKEFDTLDKFMSDWFPSKNDPKTLKNNIKDFIRDGKLN